MASSREDEGRARSSARVVPPVPGPSSTTVLAWRAPLMFTRRRSRNRELG
ncbi:MAG: hypothetical protein M5U09_25475 [Gammaproteobacteria bacterium]|nr:hypothetical protein [Gammaproteobacteria bacterium]